uniref:Mediator of RNA polymerase II transcription subunit 7 n=1 Tax=Panagrolaimus sp. PS1159 TaxID=55785 RepID=A0AC35GGG6_9BILA
MSQIFLPRKDPLKEIQYPDPPEYYKRYSKEKIKRGLCYPPPPLPSSFQIFGEVYDLKAHVIPPIETKGVQRVFGEIHRITDIKKEMTKINQSIMAAFIDLTQILIENPQSDDRIEKINNLRVLFLNFHNLINELRPIQARATLVANQRQTFYKTQKLAYDITETLAATQAALLTTKLLPRKLPTIPIPLMPELDEEEALSLESIDYVSLMEPCKAEEDEFTEIYTEKKSKRQLEEEAYILQHWKEPPKKLKERYIYRDKLIALKDETIKFESSDEDADDERTDDELESSSEEEENQDEEVVGEEATETTEMEVDVEESATKSDENESENEESDIEYSPKSSPKYQSPPPPEVQKLWQTSRDSEANKEPEVQELRKEIVDDRIEILQGMPKYFDRKAFEQYYKARGVAPDQDEEVLKVLRKKQKRIKKLQEKMEDLSSDEESEEEGSKEPPKKKKKLHTLEVIDVDSVPATTTKIIDDEDEGESGEDEIIAGGEKEKSKEASEEESGESETDSSDFDSSDFSFSDFSEIENSSDLSSDSSDDEAFLIESTIEATIGIPSKRRLENDNDDDDERIRKPRKPAKPIAPIESSDSESDHEVRRKRYKNLPHDEDEFEDESEDEIKSSTEAESDSEVIEADPASGTTLEDAGTLPSQEDSDALLASSPDNAEEESMEVSENEEDSHEQRPESLQELNRPSPVASSSPFDDDQPPVLES